MTVAEHTLLEITHNGFTFLAHGLDKESAQKCLEQRLKAILAFSDKVESNKPEFIENQIKNIIEKATDSGEFRVINLGGMGGILDGKQKISEAVSHKVDADTLRVWLHLWTFSVRSGTGLEAEKPSLEDLRWLITDDGHYIDSSHPSKKVAVSIEEKKSLIEEFRCQILIAKKFGASTRVVSQLIEIEKKLNICLLHKTDKFGMPVQFEVVNN